MSQEIKQYEKWGFFYDTDKYDFSESFKTEMCKQLKTQFDLNMNINNCVDRYGFMLSVGQSDLKLTEKDGYMFALVEILDLMSYSRTITCCWKSDDFKDPKEIQNADIKNKTVSFFWCTDFPKDEFSEVIKPNITINKGEDSINFYVDLYLNLLPDIAFYFEFAEKPTRQELKNINTFFEQYQSKNAGIYISELEEYDSEFIMMIDFQTSDENIDDYIQSLKTIFKELSKIEESKKIVKIMAR